MSTLCLLWTSISYAQSIQPVDDSGKNNNQIISRGRAVNEVVKSFDLKDEKKDFIKDCLKHSDECFFVFSARSDYDEIRFKPLILYPDVFPAYKYYDSVNIATILEIVKGFDEENSPFKPEEPITGIQAIKIVLGAANLVKWKDKFQVTEDEQKESIAYLTEPLFTEMKSSYMSELVDFDLDQFTTDQLAKLLFTDSFDDSWWQWRYLAFALKAGIIDVKQALNSDLPITDSDLSQMIAKAIEYRQSKKMPEAKIEIVKNESNQIVSGIVSRAP